MKRQRCLSKEIRKLLSRYRDNLYICLANVSDHELELVKAILASFLKNVYGIPLQWENHSKDVIWGEACIRSEASPVSLVRKGCAMSMHSDTPGEWESWVFASSPNARPVWNSHFVALLHKCLWYALSLHDIRFNLRSLMWGAGVKGYPTKWWFPTLRRLHSVYFTNMRTLRQLISWRKEGCFFSSVV